MEVVRNANIFSNYHSSFINNSKPAKEKMVNDADIFIYQSIFNDYVPYIC